MSAFVMFLLRLAKRSAGSAFLATGYSELVWVLKFMVWFCVFLASLSKRKANSLFLEVFVKNRAVIIHHLYILCAYLQKHVLSLGNIIQ